MAGSGTNYLADKLLDHALGGGDYTRPATVYVALFTARGSVAQAKANSSFTEVSGGSYARVSKTNNATNFPAAASNLKANGTAITFPAPTADWGTVVAWGIYDASTSGNLLYWGDLEANRTILNGGSAPSFPAGALQITEDA